RRRAALDPGARRRSHGTTVGPESAKGGVLSSRAADKGDGSFAKREEFLARLFDRRRLRRKHGRGRGGKDRLNAWRPRMFGGEGVHQSGGGGAEIDRQVGGQVVASEGEGRGIRRADPAPQGNLLSFSKHDRLHVVRSNPSLLRIRRVRDACRRALAQVPLR